jgi:hypothetical protein
MKPRTALVASGAPVAVGDEAGVDAVVVVVD